MAEYFDVLDEFGNKTGAIKERSAVHRDGDWHAAVNIFIVNSQNEVLQQRRAADKDSYPNMWDLSCGGHVVTGEDYETAAVRELEEELGVVVKPENLMKIGEFKTSSRPQPNFINNSIERVYLLRGGIGNLRTIRFRRKRFLIFAMCHGRNYGECCKIQGQMIC